MRNRLGSGKPCANGGTELTLIGYFTMSEGLALRFDSDVSGNSVATIGAVSCSAISARATSSSVPTSRTCVSNATGISAAVCICTGCYADSTAIMYPGYGSCAVMAGSTGNCTVTFTTGTAIAAKTCSFTVTSTDVSQSYVNYGTTYFFSPCVVLYF